ncbi:MAG: cAMP-binding protein, partial [Hyphomicrobiales bacterium]
MIAIMFAHIFRKLAFGHTRQIQLNTDDVLFHQGEQVESVYLVESGAVILKRIQKNGSEIVLTRYGPDVLVAEASLYAAHYHCEAIAAEPTSLLQLPRNYMARWLKSNPAFAHEWSAHLAGELQSARQRSEILTRNKVSDKIDGWIEWHGALPEKGAWKQLAGELGVSPEAL